MDPVNIGLTRQETEHAAIILPQGLADCRCHGLIERFVCPPRAIGNLNLIGTAFAFDHRRIIEQGGNPRAVQRRGHGEQAKIGTQCLLAVECQGEAQIVVETAFMELVEQNSTNTRKLGIIDDHAGKDARGDELDPGLFRNPGFMTNAITNGLSNRFSKKGGDVDGGRTRCKPPRFEHQDTVCTQPAGSQQGRRNAGRLAGAGCGNQNGTGGRFQGHQQFRQDFVDRQAAGGIVVAARGHGSYPVSSITLPPAAAASAGSWVTSSTGSCRLFASAKTKSRIC